MDTKYQLSGEGSRPIVYVRPVAVSDLPEDLRDQAEGSERVYAVHNENGERLALVRDEKLAFLLANQHDLAPVRVH